jgi:signal transduction histidine kinase
METSSQDDPFARLERQNAALSTLAQHPDLFINGPLAFAQRVTESATATLGVARSSVWFFTDNLRAIHCEDLFELDAGRHSEGAEFSSAQYPKYFAALTEGRSIAAHNALIDPRTAEFARAYLRPVGISSMLDAPIRMGGRLVGVLCNEHIGPQREWMPDEEAFAGSLCDILALGLEAWEHQKMAAELREARDHLELRVAERTRELAAANERLQELDRLKSTFLATMSHELRTPLNSIIGFTGILRKGLPGPINAEQEKQLSMVHGAAKHLLALINDLLDVSRIESGKTDIHCTKFRFAEMVNEVAAQLEPLCGPKNLRFRVVVTDPAIEVISDRKKCFQVLLNLAANAVKFTERGQVAVEVEHAGGTLSVSVTDTGIGIRPEKMDRLFTAFGQIDGTSQRTQDGTGLGLYLCRQLLNLLGGEIRAESTFGIGSCFTFKLPIQHTAPSDS